MKRVMRAVCDFGSPWFKCDCIVRCAEVKGDDLGELRSRYSRDEVVGYNSSAATERLGAGPPRSGEAPPRGQAGRGPAPTVD